MPELNENPRPKPPDPYIGRVIDKYTLISKLGTGGMGLVYRAEQLRIKRQVAIKLLSAKLIHDQVNVKRIEREAAAMGNLRHPNIATFHDFGISDEGQPYLVMELISGRSLGDMLDDQKRLDPERVINIIAQVADAMAYAHKQGLIHRDLKPDNIMLDNEHTNDFAKVLDFGIAKTTEDLSLTKSGVLIGSPLYMSPEQCRGSKLDVRSDIYSLGVIIYEAVTGLVPCKGDTLIETLSRKTMEQAPPFPPEFSEWKDLEQLTLACLATEPEDRPQSMAIVRDELFNMMHPGSVSMSMSSLQKRSSQTRATGSNEAVGGRTQSRGGQSQSRSPDGSQTQQGSTGQRQSRTGARRPARSTQSQRRTDQITQNQTHAQLQGHGPVLDETGQVYKPVISSKQMIAIGTTIGVVYLVSVVGIGAWLIGFDQGNGPSSLFGGSPSQASLGGSSTNKSASNGQASSSGTNKTDDSKKADNSKKTDNSSGSSTASNQGIESGVKQSLPTVKRTVVPSEAQPVKTAKAKTKQPPSTRRQIPNRYSSTSNADTWQSPARPSVPEYRPRYANRNASNGTASTNDYSGHGNTYSNAGIEFSNGQFYRANRHGQAEHDRQMREQLNARLRAAAAERAAVEEQVNRSRRFNDIDAMKKQYGGGNQWGTDTGSKFYGNGSY